MANTPYPLRAEVDAALAIIRRQYNYGASSYQGYLAIADTPTLDGWYWATQIGTYTNAGGLVTVVNKINMIEKSGATFTLNAIDVPVTPVVDGLTSTLTTSAGSANNDRLLDLKIANIIKDVEETGTFFTNEAGEVFFKFNADGADFSKVSDELKAKIVTVAQELGTSLTEVMSQDAVTTALSNVKVTKDVEEDGVYFTNEDGEVFFKFDENGVDLSKVSDELKAKLVTETQELISVTKDTEEAGAFLCNENGEVFYKFNAGVSELVGFDNPTNQPIINELEDIQNVSGATSGQYLRKMPDGTWAGAIPPISEPSFNQLTAIAEGIVQDGLVQMDARANHPMYGKHFFVFGDSHTASGFNFYSRIAQASGAIYHEINNKTVAVNSVNETHIFIRTLSTDYITYINEVDTGIVPNCDGFNMSQMSKVILDYCQANTIELGYIIVANVHFNLWDFYNADGSLKQLIPAVYLNPTKVFSRIFSNAGTATAFIYSSVGINEIVDECGFTTVDSTVKVRYGTAGQTLNFSFSSGTTLNVNTVASIRFGTSNDIVSTNLTAGMTLVQCVDAINQWAFQEFSTWNNANKGVLGNTSIPLTYDVSVGGNATEIANLTTSPTSNLRLAAPVIADTSFAYTVQFNSKNVADLRTVNKWITSGGNINWSLPNTMLGAMQYVGKFSPKTKWIFLGLWYNQVPTNNLYADGTVNPYVLLDSPSYKFGQTSKKSLKNLAEFIGGQYIDVDKLSGINVFNAVPTFNNFNDVHNTQDGYIQSVETIVNNIK